MEHGSVKLEIVHHLPHNQNGYAEDNTPVYSHIVETTLGIEYTATVAPFKCAGNGRGFIP